MERIDGEVRITLQDNSVDKVASSAVSAFDAEESGLTFAVVEVLVVVVK